MWALWPGPGGEAAQPPGWVALVGPPAPACWPPSRLQTELGAPPRCCLLLLLLTQLMQLVLQLLLKLSQLGPQGSPGG